MCLSRWLVSMLVILATSFTANAKIYTTPILADANELLQTRPDKSLEMTTRYLEQRRLSDPKELSRVHVNDETDHTIRTPLNTINALQIKARAFSLLNQPEEAISTVKTAERLATENDLSFTTLETRLIHARIYWDNLKNSATALSMLDQVDKEIEQSKALQLTKQIKVLQYQSLLQRAVIESHLDNENKAEKLFIKAKRYLMNLDDSNEVINYQLTIGHHYLQHRHFDLALDRLLGGYWLAVEQENNAKVALANFELANLFEQRKVFDKALEHATQAGEFFEHFNQTLPLAKTLALIASIYEQQGRFNLALVHYFNALDQENQLRHDIRSARCASISPGYIYNSITIPRLSSTCNIPANLRHRATTRRFRLKP